MKAIPVMLIVPFLMIAALPVHAEEQSASAELAAANASLENEFTPPAAEPAAAAPEAEPVAAVVAAVEKAVEKKAEKAAEKAGEVTDLAAEAGKIEANPAWDGIAPEVKVSKWGSELKIVVTPNTLMEEAQKLAIQSVKLETVKGEFLGLKTYGPEEKDRTAEFMLNPELLKIDAVKLTVASSTEGEWAHVASLAVEEPQAAEAEYTGQPAVEIATAAAPAAAQKDEKAKKKKGWW